MKRFLLVFGCFMFICSSATSALAVPDLFDWAFNIDGTITKALDIYDTSGMPVSGSLDADDLGVLTFTTTGAGAHSFDAFFDYEIDEGATTYFNEFGTVANLPAASQSWEIDEPGWTFGDIYDNFEASALDNTNAIEAGNPEDVSWAMGWDFILGAGESATIRLSLQKDAPGSGFYLKQTDDVTNESIYFSSTITINPTVVPEPGTMLLVGIGMIGMVGLGRRKSFKKGKK